ncbi:type II secretory pathway component PulF [Candidatus Termititenax persephonae]|uniref:Type II secretory pathway component PulF n=1 Tax=Candidatus Termititenax persephonae TaxID=2218525 RepID=A0A388TIE7_9BACT|nr:type II secretory pathway component PulF [Candidatus Termititenax persephonae]
MNILPRRSLQKNLELLEELDAFLNCGYSQGEILDLLTSELGCRYRQRLQRGQPWSSVWELEPEMALVLRTAELNGRLRDFISLALEHYRGKISFQNTLRQKAAYPLLTLGFTLLLLLGFVFFLLPLFNSLAADLGGEPPSALGQWLLLGGLVLLIANGKFFYRLLLEKTGLRQTLESIQTLNLLVMTDRAGIPLANFLAEYLRSAPRSDLSRVYFYLAKGLSVGEALSRAELFSRDELRLLTIGGGANYARGLDYLLKTFKQKYQDKINKIIFYCEPTLLLLTGGILALVAWSFFRPLFGYAGVEL